MKVATEKKNQMRYFSQGVRATHPVWLKSTSSSEGLCVRLGPAF